MLYSNYTLLFLLFYFRSARSFCCYQVFIILFSERVLFLLLSTIPQFIFISILIIFCCSYFYFCAPYYHLIIFCCFYFYFLALYLLSFNYILLFIFARFIYYHLIIFGCIYFYFRALYQWTLKVIAWKFSCNPFRHV